MENFAHNLLWMQLDILFSVFQYAHFCPMWAKLQPNLCIQAVSKWDIRNVLLCAGYLYCGQLHGEHRGLDRPVHFPPAHVCGEGRTDGALALPSKCTSLEMPMCMGKYVAPYIDLAQGASPTWLQKNALQGWREILPCRLWRKTATLTMYIFQSHQFKFIEDHGIELM